LPMNDTQGFIRRVEQEGHFHSTTSFPTEAPSARGPLFGLGTVEYFYAISLRQNQAQGHSTGAMSGVALTMYDTHD
jgi:hypothetical protein